MICPVCNSDRYKTLAFGRNCRACGSPLFKIGCVWMRRDGRAPTVKIVSKFMDMMRLGLPGYNIDPSSSEYRRELMLAATLLKKCSLSEKLALQVVETAFIGQYRAYMASSLSHIMGKGFSARLAESERLLTARHAANESTRRAMEQIGRK